jgi:hypothetical protein
MQKYLIIVEGVADAVFIRDCIYHANEKNEKFIQSSKIGKFSKGKPNKIAEAPEIKILNAGGCKHIKEYKTKIIEAFDINYELIVIQDADNPLKDPDTGGTKKRMVFLESIKKEFNIEFETFLFPNNKDNGDLETLLLQIVNKEKFKKSFDCYKKYADCVKFFSEEKHSNELLEDKYKVYNYFRTYHGMENAKEENREYKSEYWDFSNDAIMIFLNFLERVIMI